MKNSKKRNKGFKEFWKKFWFIVWKDDSLKGWVISIIFLFLFIKLIFFPVLNFTTGTSLPLAIVESCSMYHQGNVFSNFNEWWQRHDEKYSRLKITSSEFRTFKLKNGFGKGDILFIVGVKPEKVKIGDIIIFNANQRNPIIHRVINITKENNKYIFSTMGDNNNGQLTFEHAIPQNELIGKAVFRIAPYLGWGKLIFFEGSKPPQERGFCREN